MRDLEISNTEGKFDLQILEQVLSVDDELSNEVKRTLNVNEDGNFILYVSLI